MNEVLEQVPMSVLVLACVLILERIFPLRENINPLGFFKSLALGISAKVHSDKKSNSVSQQKVAGFLAIPTLLLPFLFLGYMLTLLTDFPYIFDAVLLWMCLSWSPIRKDALSIEKALKKEQKSLAKAKLDSWVLRETSTLSPMGICKSTIEMLMLRATKEYFAVILYYLLLGSLVMLGYRLLTLLGQCWNPKAPHYRHFGQAIQGLCFIFDWLPSRLVSLALMMMGGFKLTLTLMRNARQWQNDNSLMLLSATAALLKVSLGGPAIYHGQKIRRSVIGNDSTRAPELQDIRHTVNLVERVLLVWLLFITLITILYYGISVMK